MKNQIGIVGLAAMGSNLAMNFADHKFRTAVYNRSPERTEALIADYGSGRGLDPTYTLEAFVSSLERPRKIILMVKAGEATDAVISQLSALLEAGDILIDGGNSFFRDTIRRAESLKPKDIRFVGMGISGGEEGARRGPSLMPGATGDLWTELRPMLEPIAAKDFDGNPCVAPIGEGGAGHFVKMVHNGIEYADMQLIAETYLLMKRSLYWSSNDDIASAFEKWNAGRLGSYLIEITADIFRVKEQDGGYLIDRILDTAGAKGTGKWTADEALSLGAPSFSIAAAVFARSASSNKEMRSKISEVFGNSGGGTLVDMPDDLESALYAAKLLSYAQGYELLSLASKEFGWELNFGEISRIWQGGCIIRARFLRELTQVYAGAQAPEHLLLSSFAKEAIERDIESLRKVSAAAVSIGVSTPGLLSSLSYFDTMRGAVGSANLIQAQRDYFGAHTFQREPGGEPEHFDWEAATGAR